MTKRMLVGSVEINKECADGYSDAREGFPPPTHKHHPAYIHGYRNGLRDMRQIPPIRMNKIITTWNYIVATCDDAR